MAASMQDSAARFNREVLEFGATLTPQLAVLLVKKVSLQVLTGVVLRTPVDTGRARGNWQLTLGEPAEKVIDRSDKNENPMTVGQEMAKAAQINKLGVDVFITNNVEYILYLEEGTSKQAPSGMVALTLEEVAGQFA